MKSEEIFADTSAWVALADKGDKFHLKAAEIYPSLLGSYRSLVTSNLVLAETYVLLLKTLGRRVALDFLERVGGSPRISKIYPNEALEKDAMELLTRYQDQNFSYTDAVSFAIMNKRNILKAFSLDRHFLTAGFVNIP